MKIVDGASKYDGLIALADLVIDVIGHEFEIHHPRSRDMITLGDLSKSVNEFARPENLVALRGLVRKHNPDIDDETLDRVALGIKVAASMVKLAYCSAMMVGGNPFPMYKMALGHFRDTLGSHDNIRKRFLGILKEDGIDPDDTPPPRGGKMPVPKPKPETSYAAAHQAERRVAGGRMYAPAAMRLRGPGF